MANSSNFGVQMVPLNAPFCKVYIYTDLTASITQNLVGYWLGPIMADVFVKGQRAIYTSTDEDKDGS